MEIIGILETNTLYYQRLPIQYSISSWFMPNKMWETDVNGMHLTITVRTQPSSRPDQDVKFIYVDFDDAMYCFVTKIVNKEARMKKGSNFNSVFTSEIDNELSFLIREIAIRSQIDFNGLCKLMAVRDSEQFTFLFEELCDLGIAMRETLTGLERPKETLALQKILHLPEEPSLTYCEKEVCYIMWNVFHTLQDLHSSQICHLDIRPSNIYLTSSGEVKLGGTCFLTDFSTDSFGGLRHNLPGQKEYLLPEYWQNGFVSCYAADIWAACVSLYVMIKGFYPFPLENIELYMRQMTSYDDLPNLSGLSEELQDLLTHCFSPVISKRPTLKDILKHPWFIKNDYIENGRIFSYHTQPKSSIPTTWTNTSMTEFNCIIDSCYDKLMHNVYGGIEGFQETHIIQSPVDKKKNQSILVSSSEASSRLSKKKGNNLSSTQEKPQPRLPKQGIVRVSDHSSCVVCWKKKELYVERGKLVIGGIRKPNKISIPILDIRKYGVEDEMKCIFKIHLRDERTFFFKVATEGEAVDWVNAIHLSMQLS